MKKQWEGKKIKLFQSCFFFIWNTSEREEGVDIYKKKWGKINYPIKTFQIYQITLLIRFTL